MRKRPAFQLLQLEDRTVPSTFTVTTTSDSGTGSLRSAIIQANATPGFDTINFVIPGSGVQTIAPTTALPDITEAVKIDGTTQVVQLLGTSAGAGSNGLSFVNHTGSTVLSLTVGGFSGAGVRISGGGSNNIYGCLIGTNATGTAAQANSVGIQVENASLGNAIGGNGANQRNIISGNSGPGVRIDNAYNTLVAGNFIGTDVNGNAAIANAGGGVYLRNGAAGNTIGGVVAGLGNVISGNGTAGVVLDGALTSSNIIVGNRIGLNFGGAGLSNTGPGIKAFNAADSAPPGGTIAGTENTVRANTIADNTGAGVAVLDTSRQVRIDANSIHDNGGPGIQVDATANAGLQKPTINSIKAVSGGQSVSGTFSGLASTKYDVNIFTNSTADPSGFGEGQTQVGTVAVTTDASGAGAFSYLLATSAGGTYITATVLYDALGDTSAFSNAFLRPNTLLGPGIFAIGGGAGGDAAVVITDAIGTNIRSGTFFTSGFSGGVRVAMADLTGDGIPDLAVATGVGIAAQVLVYDGNTQQQLFSINPFGSFTGGVFVALGDLTGDGVADLVISPDEGGGPRCRVFNGKTFTQIADFFGIDDVNFRGGCRTAVGDLTGDKRGDLIVSAGFGGGPRIAVFDGAQLGSNGGPKPFGDFFAFEPTLRNGAYVACADVNADGFAELIVGAGPGGGPRVRILDGKILLNSSGHTLTAIDDFFAGDTASRGGVRVASRDLNGDGKAELVTGQGDGSNIHVYRGTDLAVGMTTNNTEFDLLSSRTDGMYVG